MSYTSVKFLVFTAAVFVAYFAVPKKYRWLTLLAASFFFYAGVGLRAVLFITFSALSTYLAGLGMGQVQKQIARIKEKAPADLSLQVKKLTKRKKWILVLAVLANLGILGYMKYFNFMASNLNQLFSALSWNFSVTTRQIIMPLGLSFYTFQIVGYLIDVSRGKVEPEKNPAKYFLFVTFFPQIIQGPIGRFGDLAHQLYEGHEWKWSRVYDGLILIMWGFFKKMVIADRAAIFADRVFGNWQQYAGVETFLGLFFYGIQLYADVSGGIDISRGIAQVLGIQMAENFNRPFFAKSIQEYWNRWHMSLGAWMRDYVFYSVRSVKFIAKTTKKTTRIFGKKLGKNIPSALVTCLCFLLIGIWHDASWNYVAFGMINGLLIGGSTILKPYFRKWQEWLGIDRHSGAWQLFRMVRTFLICMVMRVSHSGALRASAGMVASLFRQLRLSRLFDGSLLSDYGLTSMDYSILLVCCTIFFVVSLATERGTDVREWIRQQGFLVKVLVPLFLIFMTMMFAVLENNLVGGFLYAQF